SALLHLQQSAGYKYLREICGPCRQAAACPFFRRFSRFRQTMTRQIPTSKSACPGLPPPCRGGRQTSIHKYGSFNSPILSSPAIPLCDRRAALDRTAEGGRPYVISGGSGLRLKRFIAAARPSVKSTFTASAAVSSTSSTAFNCDFRNGFR